MRTPALVFAMLSYLSVCFSQTRFYDEQKPISIQTDYSEIVIHFENKTDFDTFTKRAIAPYSLIKIIPKYLAVVVAFGPGFQPHVELNELAIFDGLNIRNSFFARKLDDNFKLYLSHRMLFAPLENLDPYGPEIASFISRYGNGKIESNPFGLFYSIELDNPLATLALANALVENGLVAWAHPDFYANHTRHIDRSARKTGRVLVLHEDTGFGGLGGEIAALVTENCFASLDAPVMRCTSLDSPVPFAGNLELAFLANSRLGEVIDKLLEY